MNFQVEPLVTLKTRKEFRFRQAGWCERHGRSVVNVGRRHTVLGVISHFLRWYEEQLC